VPHSYTSELCSFIAKKKQCPQGDACIYCHTRVEEFYHPDKYKAKFCQSHLSVTGLCDYGEYCSFAHNESEISIDLIGKFDMDVDFYYFHYKTVWCPFVDSSHMRDGTCPYAHNWQDFRRKPQLKKYSREPCPRWDTTKTISVY